MTRPGEPLADVDATRAPATGPLWQMPASQLGATTASAELDATSRAAETLARMERRASWPGIAQTRGTAAAGPGAPTMPERLGRYMVIKELGAGGMGVVYKAFDPDLDRKVALKLLLGQATPQARARLLREAQAMAKLSHPNVVPVFDVGVVDGQVFVAMDFVDGMTLSVWMESRHPWQDVVEVFVQAGRGLAAAHAVGLIHRDFKPDNVLLRRDPATGELQAQVADFGLARRDDETGESITRPEPAVVMQSRHSLLDQGLTRIGAVIGTPTYMSPEQHVGATVDARTDQFSFCVALFEALYGERPFTGETLEALAIAASGPRRPPPDRKVPGWLYRLCLRGMQPAREARFPDMEALLLEISRRRAQGRHRWFAAAGGVAVIGALAAVLVNRGQPAEQRCAGGPARVAGVWDEAVQARAEQAFAATGVVYAADAWKAARGHVDRYGEAWATMYRDSCEATDRGEQSAELMDLRTACLGRALQDLSALARLYVAADK
ncbi:MAG TPA: serine/threonine-protein kinase, partial [Nannocystis sp.]